MYIQILAAVAGAFAGAPYGEAIAVAIAGPCFGEVGVIAGALVSGVAGAAFGEFVEAKAVG